MPSLRHQSTRCAGFSMVEVLVTVVLVATTMTAVVGVIRADARATALLRTHAEARMLLEHAVNRFQYGDGAARDTLIQGQYGAYAISFREQTSSEPGEDGHQSIVSARGGLGSEEFLDSLDLRRRRIEVRWQDIDRERSLVVAAWRWLRPEERADSVQVRST